MKDLYNIIIPKVANDWYDLGVQLFSESQLPRLDEISATFSNDRRRGCVEMLKYWLKIIPEATWDNLICALRAPGLQLLAIADEVEKEVKGKCVNVNVYNHFMRKRVHYSLNIHLKLCISFEMNIQNCIGMFTKCVVS